MFEKLHKLAGQFVHFTSKEKLIFENAFTFKQIPKNYTLVKEGEIADEIYFINKGLLRLYYNKEGEYITGYIFREHLFASSYDSFLQRAPSIQYLESLEESDLLAITYDRMEELYKELPKMNILVRKIAEQRFINAQQILSSFLIDSPEVRYRKFAGKNGDLFLRIPHHIIASYLGITPVSLSRIRKRVIKKP